MGIFLKDRQKAVKIIIELIKTHPDLASQNNREISLTLIMILKQMTFHDRLIVDMVFRAGLAEKEKAAKILKDLDAAGKIALDKKTEEDSLLSILNVDPDKLNSKKLDINRRLMMEKNLFPLGPPAKS